MAIGEKTQPCRRCGKRQSWGRSPLCFSCLGETELLVTAEGEVVDPSRPPSRAALYPARYRYREVRCGKDDCGRCPHEWYVYRAWRADRRARERYLGPATQIGDAYELPELRRPLTSMGGLR
jgi:hypothetical protein